MAECYLDYKDSIWTLQIKNLMYPANSYSTYRYQIWRSAISLNKWSIFKDVDYKPSDENCNSFVSNTITDNNFGSTGDIVGYKFKVKAWATYRSKEYTVNNGEFSKPVIRSATRIYNLLEMIDSRTVMAGVYGLQYIANDYSSFKISLEKYNNNSSSWTAYKSYDFTPSQGAQSNNNKDITFNITNLETNSRYRMKAYAKLGNTWWPVNNELPSNEVILGMYKTENPLVSIDDNARGTYNDKGLNIHKYYETFSGCDAIAELVFPGNKHIVLGQVSTLSYSTMRVKNQIKTLGRISPRGFTKGSRTVAGSLIFTVFNRHWTNDVKEAYPNLFSDIKTLKADELPPFDIIINYANEYGVSSYYVIYGVTIVEEGQVVSVEDTITENVCQFMARDIDLMTSFVGQRPSESVDFRSATYDKLGSFHVVDSLVNNKISSNSFQQYVNNKYTNIKATGDILTQPKKIGNIDLEVTFQNQDGRDFFTVEETVKMTITVAYHKDASTIGLNPKYDLGTFTALLLFTRYTFEDIPNNHDESTVDSSIMEINIAYEVQRGIDGEIAEGVFPNIILRDIRNPFEPDGTKKVLKVITRR